MTGAGAGWRGRDARMIVSLLAISPGLFCPVWRPSAWSPADNGLRSSRAAGCMRVCSTMDNAIPWPEYGAPSEAEVACNSRRSRAKADQQRLTLAVILRSTKVDVAVANKTRLSEVENVERRTF